MRLFFSFVLSFSDGPIPLQKSPSPNSRKPLFGSRLLGGGGILQRSRCAWQSWLEGLLEEGPYEKSPKCLGGDFGEFGGFCKGLNLLIIDLFSSFL